MNPDPTHFCCAPNCPGYPWKASESRHPCGDAALTDATLPDLPIPAAVWTYVRDVADTIEPADADPGDNDDADLVPLVAMNVESALSAEDGQPVQPYDLDFYDDPEWGLSVGTPWHADRCERDYFRHPKPAQTGDCDPWRRIPCPLT